MSWGARLQAAAVEAAWTILRRRTPANAALHDWAAGIAARRGPRVAVVALARKLAGILYAMWRDGASLETSSTSGGIEEEIYLSLQSLRFSG